MINLRVRQFLLTAIAAALLGASAIAVTNGALRLTGTVAAAEPAYTGMVLSDERGRNEAPTRILDADPATVTGHFFTGGTPEVVRVSASSWSFEFGAGPEPFHLGRYDNVSGDSPFSPYSAGMYAYNGTVCTGEGSFTIVELPVALPDGTLQSFAIDFIFRCKTPFGIPPPIQWLHGSIRLAAATPPSVVSSPRTAEFADTTVGNSAVETVTLQGLGRGVAAIASIDVSGTDGAMVTIENDGCSGVPLSDGGTCSFDVRFSPTATTLRTARVTAIGSSPASEHTITVTGIGRSPLLEVPSSMVLVSDPGEWIGSGQTAVFGTSDLWMRNRSYAATVDYDIGSAVFGAVEGQVLSIGHYEVPTYPPYDLPYLSVSAFGHSCQPTGSFDVVDPPIFDVDGVLLRFGVDFGQHCDGSPLLLRGSLRFHSTIPLADMAPPSGQVSVAGGIDSVSRTAVRLNVSATDPSGVALVALSNDGVAWTNLAYAPTVDWTVTAGDGTKVVYARWRDLPGNWSSPASTSLTLDTVSPTGSVSIASGVATARLTSVTISVPATDVASGLSLVGLSNDGAAWTYRAYEATQSWTLPATNGTRTVYAKWKDAAGNWSAVKSDTIVLDTVAPAGSITVAGGSPTTRLAAVTLGVGATDATSGVSQVGLSNDGATWTYRAYGATQSWTLSATNGSRTVYAKWKDAAGNWSAVKSDTIVLDTVAPTVTPPSWRIGSAGTALVGGAMPVRLAWTGSDATSGVATFALIQSTDGGAWVTVSSNLTGTTLTRNLAPGHSYRFGIRAIDKSGNATGYAYGLTFRLAAVQQAGAGVKYAGTWTTSTSTTWWGGTARSSSRLGSTASLTFTGRQFDWIGFKGPTRGKAQIFVNGNLTATVDLFASTQQAQRVVWSGAWSTSVSRTIKIRILATSGRPRVDIDGFVFGT